MTDLPRTVCPHRPDRAGPAGVIALGLAFGLALGLAGVASAQGLAIPPGLREAVQPGFLRRDLAVMESMLGLGSEQVVVVETLFNDYEQAFAEGGREVRRQISELRPDPARLARSAARSRHEIYEEIRAMQEEIRQRASATKDPQARQELVDEFRRREKEYRAKMEHQQSDGQATEEMAEALAQMAAVIRDWEVAKDRLGAEFALDVQAILTEPQASRWPSFERRLRRERTLGGGHLSGESVDLFIVTADLDLPADVRAALAEVLGAYELRLDAALVARNDALHGSRDALATAMQSRDGETELAITARLMAFRQALRDVNHAFAEEAASRLPSEFAAAFRAAFFQRAYPAIFRPTPGARMLRAARELPGLSAETLAAIDELERGFLAEVAGHNEQIRAATFAHEPALMVARVERRVRAAEGAPVSTADPVREAFASRGALEDRSAASLRALLTDEQFASLPGASPGTGRYRGDDGAGGLAGQEWALREFDADGDGELDAEERQRLIEHLRKNQ